MITIILTILGVYLFGLMAYYISDGWFHWTSGVYRDEILPFYLFWPLTLWYVVARSLKEKLESARSIHDKNVAEQIRIRVQAEKEIAETIFLLEGELEEEKPKRRRRTR